MSPRKQVLVLKSCAVFLNSRSVADCVGDVSQQVSVKSAMRFQVIYLLANNKATKTGAPMSATLLTGSADV